MVTGARGFIGHHLVKRLVQEGFNVRGVDIKEPAYEPAMAESLVTINQLVDYAAAVAGKQILKRHDVSKPQGRQTLKWEPSILLRYGLETTYAWIEEELRKAGRTPAMSSGQTASA